MLKGVRCRWSKPNGKTYGFTVFAQNWFDIGYGNRLVQRFFKLSFSRAFESQSILNGGDKLRADVQDRVPFFIKCINNLLSKLKLVRTIDNRPILEKVSRTQENKEQNQGTQDIVLQSSALVDPKENVVRDFRKLPHRLQI